MNKWLKKIVVSIITLEAKLVLWRYSPRVIAVTGSVGKTTTKDLIYSLLKESYNTRKNIKSFNSEIGVPLTVLDLPNAWSSPGAWLKNLLLGFWRASTCYLVPSTYPKWLVLEVGADHPGDIKSLVSWLRPKVGVFTGLGTDTPVHVEYFPNIESLVAEKTELIKILPEDGTAVLNRDDVKVWENRGETHAHLVSYGFESEAKVRGANYHIAYSKSGVPTGVTYRLDYAGKSVPIRLNGVLGKGVAYASLGAASVALNLGVNVVDVSTLLAGHNFAPGRMRLLDGINGSVLIDDTYNSSPSAVRMSLDVLREIKLVPALTDKRQPRKIVVLGGMMELGQYTRQEHEKVGEWLRGVVDTIVCVGALGRVIGESALADGCEQRQVYFFENAILAGEFLQTYVQNGDLVLLKASQSVRLEGATKTLLANQDEASIVLVRQAADWLLKK